MNEVTDEHDSDPIDVSNENIFTNNHYGFEQTTKRSFKTDGDADNREDNFSKGQVDDVDEKVFLKWALEKRKKEYESIKKRYLKLSISIKFQCIKFIFRYNNPSIHIL